MKILTILLTVLFIGLKLTSHIDWSWFWVMSPLIIYVALYTLCIVLFFALAFVVALFGEVKLTKKKSN